MNLNVAHLVISLDCGGLEKLVVQWTNLRNDVRGANATRIICLDHTGDLACEVPSANVHCVNAVRSRFPWDRPAVRSLRELLRTHRIDIVHSHNLTAMQYAQLATAWTRIRHVYTQHGANPHLLGIKDRVRGRLLAMATDRIVAVSAATADSMAAKQGFSRRWIDVVRNGVVPHPGYMPASINALRKQLAVPSDALVLGSVGRLAAVKGWDRFLPVVRRMRGMCPRPLRLLLVGDGPDRTKIENLADALDLRDTIIFAGYQDEPRRFLSLMDGFVLPSLSEGLSVALLEAMAASRPVFVTDVGENRAVIASGDAGVLLPEEEQRWHRHILDVLLDRDRCAALGRAAYERVYGDYLIDATLNQYETIYSQVSRLTPVVTARPPELVT